MQTTLDATRETEAPVAAVRRRPMRRRFAFASAGILAILCAALGVNFAADSGTTTPQVNGSSNSVTVTPGTPQTWSVSAGSSGSVPSPQAGQHIATIDASGATSTKLQVSVYVTNMDKLSPNYSSWTFKIALRAASGVTPDTVQTVTADTLTSDSGMVSFVVDLPFENTHHDAVTSFDVDLMGGSFYTVSTDQTSASIKPDFFVRASQL